MNEKRIEIKRSVAIAFLAVVLVAGGVAGSFATARAGLLPSGVQNAGPVFQVSAGAPPLVDQASLAQGFRPVVKKALPAVVNISTTRVVRTDPRQPSTLPFFGPFREFFEEFGAPFDIPRERRERSLGSGVVVSADGYILTNHHVVQDADEIVVAFDDKREMKARVVGSDPRTDVAVLKIDEKDLPFLTLGDSDKLDVGDLVLAMGNPFGFGHSVTMGIVSAMGRDTRAPDTLADFIQTDAAINRGNSGGPLVNVSGELIGINTAIFSPTGGFVGIGFAIPSNVARDVMEQIVAKGRVVRGWLGVSIQPVTPEVMQIYELKEARGALVGDLAKDSPAARSDLTRGDVIVAVDGDRVDDVRDLQFRIARSTPGTRVTLTVIRDGKEVKVPVTLGELPEAEQRAGPEEPERGALDGVSVSELTPQVTRQLRLPPDVTGVVVTSVRQFSPAAEAGLRRGDVVVEVNRRPVPDVATFERAIRQTGDDPIMLLVNRGGSTMFLVVKPR